MNNKQAKYLSITLTSFGIILICSGLVMNAQIKPIINTSYTLTIKSKKISEAQAKASEIKVKDIEIEVNNPLSVDVKDYIEDIEKISQNILKNLKLDTSLVNVNQTGSYQYIISYGKKKYIGKITVNEKENKTPPFTVKELIEIPKGASLNVYNVADYLKDVPDKDVLSNIRIDTSEVNLNVCATYPFYAIYKDTKYQGQIKIYDEQIIAPTQQKEETHTCEKINGKYYDKSGNEVDEISYTASCKNLKCTIYKTQNGQYYFDSEGKLASYEEFNKQCPSDEQS